MNIKILECFKKLDPLKPLEISSVNEELFYFDVHIKNALMDSSLAHELAPYFPHTNCTILSNENNVEEIILRVSKVKQPKAPYSADPYIKTIMDNEEDKIFIGMGKFGPEYLNIDKITHLAVYGKTGFGKSTFLKYVMSQLMAFRPDVQHILFDAKGTEFSPFKNHSSVLAYARSANDMVHMMNYLSLEIARREYIFNESFSIAPSKLSEYREFKKKFNREDLPELKKIIVWIDEGRSFHQNLDNSFNEHHATFKSLLMRCRAVGISVVLSSQSTNSYSSDSLFTQYLVFTCDGSSASQFLHNTSDIDVGKGRDYDVVDLKIPGRFAIIDNESNQKLLIQAPFCSSQDAVNYAFRLNPKVKSIAKDEYKHPYDFELLKTTYIAKLVLAKSFSYDQFLNYEFVDESFFNEGSNPIKLNLQTQAGFLESKNPFEHLLENCPVEFEVPVVENKETKENIFFTKEDFKDTESAFAKFEAILDQPVESKKEEAPKEEVKKVKTKKKGKIKE